MTITTILAGDTFTHTLENDDYDGTYTAHLKLRGASTINIAGTKSDGVYTFTETAANTAAWTVGKYLYVIYVSDGTTEKTLETGSVDIEYRPDLNPASDIRTHAEKTLDAIEAVIEGRATVDQQSYTIKGRTLTRMSLDDLLKFRQIYRNEVRREQGKTRRKILVRM